MLFKRPSGDGVEGLERGERVLVTAQGPHGRVVATDRRLVWPAGSISWHEIERASWDGDDDVLNVVPVAAAERQRLYRVSVTKPGRLVDVVREQVIRSVVVSRHVPLDERRGVRVTGRRTADGSLVWQAVLDAGVDVDAPGMRPRVDAAVAAVRSEVE